MRMGAWVPERAVPWCLGRLPWVPGAPPGAPWGGVPAQSLRVTLCPATFGFASKFMSILMSMFDPLGVVLRSVLGVMFGRFGAIVGLSWSQNRLRVDSSSKKQNVHETLRFPMVVHVFHPRWRSQMAQDRPKTGPRSVWITFC